MALLDGDISWSGSVLLVFDGLLLTCLFLRDSRARIDPPGGSDGRAGAAVLPPEGVRHGGQCSRPRRP